MKKTLHVQLSKEDREYLETLISKGERKAKVYRRSMALLELDRGQTYTAVSSTLKVSKVTLSKWSAKYRETGLEALQDQPHSGRPIEIGGEQRAKVTALACSDPPEGYAQWTLRLLADKAVELEHCEHISHTEVAMIQKKRTQASSQANLVYRKARQPISGTHGADIEIVCVTILSTISGDLL